LQGFPPAGFHGRKNSLSALVLTMWHEMAWINHQNQNRRKKIPSFEVNLPMNEQSIRNISLMKIMLGQLTNIKSITSH
jgi:hypothetical protein